MTPRWGAIYISPHLSIETARAVQPTIAVMIPNDAEKLDLAALEVRVDELIKTVNSLANENDALRAQQQSLVAERAALIEKTELARTRVEAMIQRLKAMETRT